MGSGTFFSKVASSPLFQKLDLPGSHKYQDTLENVIGPNTGPYAAASLQGANAGYRAGGPGSIVGAAGAPDVGSNAAGWGHPAVGGLAGFMDNVVGKGLSLDPAMNTTLTNAGNATNAAGQAVNGNASGANPWVDAARNATSAKVQW